MSKRLFLVLYVIAIHVALAAEALRLVAGRLRAPPPTSELSEYYRRIVKYHDRIDGNVPSGAAIFIGDSHVQGLCVDAVAAPAVNFGIGSDTTAGVLYRLPEYHCLARAGVVVFHVGVNDLRQRGDAEILDNFRQILHHVPGGVPVVVSGLMPIAASQTDPAMDRARLRRLNHALEGLCEHDRRSVFADPFAPLADGAGHLSPQFDDGDGMHLSAAGYRAWIEVLKKAVSIARQKRRSDEVTR